jgi:hypothetical protein
MTLREKFARDGTTLANVQYRVPLDEECLAETLIELGRDRKYVLSELKHGGYILDVLGSGDTIAISEDEIGEDRHADVWHLLGRDRELELRAAAAERRTLCEDCENGVHMLIRYGCSCACHGN